MGYGWDYIYFDSFVFLPRVKPKWFGSILFPTVKPEFVRIFFVIRHFFPRLRPLGYVFSNI